MILGIGTDLVNNKKIKKIYQKYGDRFLNKILSAKVSDRIRHGTIDAIGANEWRHWSSNGDAPSWCHC